jgi:hypothetical protein
MLAVGIAVATARGNSASGPYIWRNVVIGGGGFVTAIITHPAQNYLWQSRSLNHKQGLLNFQGNQFDRKNCVG